MKRFALPVLIILSLTVLFGLQGCKTIEEPPVEEVMPEPVHEPALEAVVEPDEFEIDWEGTTWIFRDEPGDTREFPGYRGFHLGRDGQLLLINMNEALGDSWSAYRNRLTLNLAEKSGEPGLPIKGEFKAVIPGTGSGMPGTPLIGEGVSGSVLVQLIPTKPETPGDAGIIFEQAKVNIDVIENHWIPREMEQGGSVPWPMNREIHLMLLPDATGGMGILGYGGENRFRGEVYLGVDAFITSSITMTRKAGPASNFENLYVRNISASDRYVQVDDDLFLYADTAPKVAFRVRLFD